MRARITVDRGTLSPSTVLGVFFYKNDESEVDIELTRWGRRAGKDLHLSVHHTGDSTTRSFMMPVEGASAELIMCKSSDSVSTTVTVNDQVFRQDIVLDSPLPGEHHLHVNLWSRALDMHIHAPPEQVLFELLDLNAVESCATGAL